MNQPVPPESNPPPQPKPGIQQQAVDSTMGNGMQGIQGDNNTQVQGNNNWIIKTLNFLPSSQQIVSETGLTRQEYHNRQALLNKVRNFWIKGVLEKSLYDQVLIELGLEKRNDAIAHPWNFVLQADDEPQQPLPQGTKVIDVFDQLGTGRTLLILGEPGSGKTTTLLELTQELISRAEQDIAKNLIPVVFHLSSWSIQKQDISAWLVEELNTKYQVPKKIGETWVKEQQLIFLLDGLDEVWTGYQDDCITALNKFHQEYSPEIVVCSRTEDYENLSNRLNFQIAVYLMSLTQEQVRRYLASNSLSSEFSRLRGLIKQDKVLQEFAKSPVMLNFIILAYRGLDSEDLPKSSSIPERRQHLFDTYITRIFNHQFDDRKSDNQKYYRQQVQLWLIWLSRRMLGHQSLFLIEEMQPSWLLTNKQRWQYILSSRLIGGIIFVLPFCIVRIIHPTNIPVLLPTLLSILFFGIVISLIDGLFIYQHSQARYTETNLKLNNYWHLFLSITASGLIFGLIFGLIIKFPIGLMMGLPFGTFAGLLFGLRGMRVHLNSDIKTYERLNWSWKDSIKWALISLIIAIIVAFLIALILTTEYRTPLRLVFTLISVSLGTVFGGLSSADIKIEKRSNPNQGIRDSVKSAILGAIIGGFIGILVGIFRGEKYLYAVETFATLGMSMGALWYGGLDIIQHLSLRFILYCNGYTPWNYQQFLDYATELILLQKVGGGYIFIHRLLMEHFAQMPVDSQAK